MLRRGRGPPGVGGADEAPRLELVSVLDVETNPISLTAPLPLLQTAAALGAGALDLIQHVQDRCDRIDAVESEVRALVPEPRRRDRLLREAAVLLERHPHPDSRPPLWGVLVGVKDIFAVDGFATRGGSALPPQLFSMPEATSVVRLREAGALVLGKTVTTEFAFSDPGSTANPHNPQHTPGGSSSGSAAAVAAGYAPLAIGTQTVGSISRPAAFCGVVGFKPSHARVPTDGILPVSKSIDQVGSFTQDAAGAALVASVLCDGWCAPLGDATPELLPVLGVPEGPYLEQIDQATRQHFDTQLARLETRGYTVRSVPSLQDLASITDHHTTLFTAEFAEVHDAWFRDYGALYRPRSALLVQSGRSVAEQALAAARESPLSVRSALEALMSHHGIDAWVSPSTLGPAPVGLGATGNPAMNMPWTHGGLPTITLPAGVSAGGLPLGLQIAAKFGADEALLGWSQDVEVLLRE